VSAATDSNRDRLHELLAEYRGSDILKKMRMPVELLTVPPGASILLNGVEASQKTPCVQRLDPYSATKVELRKRGFKAASFKLGPFNAATDAAKYQYTTDLRRTATWSRSIRGHIESDPTAWGNRVAVVERNGRPTGSEAWRDTVLIDRQESAKIAFVADNPGKWMVHCHMLEHQAAGMATWFNVEA